MKVVAPPTPRVVGTTKQYQYGIRTEVRQEPVMMTLVQRIDSQREMKICQCILEILVVKFGHMIQTVLKTQMLSLYTMLKNGNRGLVRNENQKGGTSRCFVFCSRFFWREVFPQ